ncbi:permease [Thermoanaerobacter sp. YS13]|uniref:sulfite exporter TauE/SafE family protein n=1 Tax=Thermoanaerobacter sp. YS13 TaxID=1511746 RepID=UPI000575AC79|nr:sulfite exporter TauE/SafE family protein [Thermoanaerobacter sp. YS13]KHO62658.1 permease [Thermoanaerobacter sp. YS13]
MKNYILILMASVLAGATNAIAGGGTLITFPALLWVGINPLSSNITNTVALWTGSITGAWAFKERFSQTKELLRFLTLPSLLGGILGAYLLMITPHKVFDFIVPFLILFATLVLALNEKIHVFSLRGKRERAGGSLVVVFILQFLTSLYGGYFAAGIGILMLAALGIAGITDIHTANGIKNVLSLFINVTSGLVLIFSGKVVWVYAFILMLGFALGGYLGGAISQKFDSRKVKKFVVLWGFVLAIVFWVKGV